MHKDLFSTAFSWKRADAISNEIYIDIEMPVNRHSLVLFLILFLCLCLSINALLFGISHRYIAFPHITQKHRNGKKK